MRQTIKTISSKPIKFIPKKYAEDPTLREDAENILERPLIAMVRKISRDEEYAIREFLTLKDPSNPEKGLTGVGSVVKYIFENNVLELHNVAYEDEGGEVVMKDVVKGAEKNALFNSYGMDGDIDEIVFHVRKISSLDEAEAKNLP